MTPAYLTFKPAAPRLTVLSGSVLAVLAALPAAGSAQERQERLEEIVITSSMLPQPRRQIATAVSVIEAPELELRGYTDIADVLRTQTGIGVSNTGGPGKVTTVRIRGEEGYRTMMLIDGVKAVDPTAPQTAPRFDSLLTTGDIQRVEVLRGPQGFMYGADAGGVVSIMTQRGEDDFGGRVGIEYGEFETTQYDANVSGGGDKGDYFVSVTDLETDGFNALKADTVLADDDGAENTTLHTKLGWNATENVRLQLVARDIDASTLYDNCFHPVTFANVHDCVGTLDMRTYKVSVEQTGERFSNSFGYSDMTVDRLDLTQGLTSFQTEGDISRFEYMGRFIASDAHTLVYGVDLEQDEVRSTTSTQSRDQDGYYVEYQGEFSDQFFLTLGARYDDNEDFGTHTSTRASVAYVQELRGGNSLKYRASVGTGFRAPSLFEITYNERPTGVLPAAQATPLTEEQSEGYDVGIEYATDNGFVFEVTYFDQEILDQIGYLSGGPPLFLDGYVQTPGISESTGVELGVEAPIGDQWAFFANWTNNDTKTATGARRLRRPENLGNLGVRYTSPGEALGFIANYRIQHDAIDVGNVPLDDYEVLDLSLNWSINDTFDLYGRVQNAFDEEYTEVSNYNTAGRAFYAGVRLNF